MVVDGGEGEVDVGRRVPQRVGLFEEDFGDVRKEFGFVVESGGGELSGEGAVLPWISCVLAEELSPGGREGGGESVGGAGEEVEGVDELVQCGVLGAGW